MKRTLTALGIFAVGLLTPAIFWSNPATATPTADCRTVTSNITNRPDSASWGGNWAKDTFTRTVKICAEAASAPAGPQAAVVENWKYTAEAVDGGTFVTDGVKSFAGAAMKSGVSGKLEGGFKAALVGPTNFEGLKTTGTDTNTKSSSQWMDWIWPSSKSELTSWGWTYTTCNETLKNTSAGNSGDITGLSRTPCFGATFADTCTGTTVTLTNTLSVVPARFRINAGDDFFVAKDGTKTVTISSATKDVVVQKYVNGKGWVDLAKHTWKLPASCTSGAPSSAPPVVGGNTTPTLPVTGSNVPVFAASGAGVLAVGALLFFLARRRRNKFVIEE